ncbi:hypothetical protein LOK49_LG02G02881 [Camellia lanceoleosa]|uniref:Uncharacterized protein n=1 Tax=Camellia lanceoleosa TaxID=1840588 RepID=A0ACC0IL03_9ERIC|nr:hypothetical protein LOK49_LG02G02881 [Camellia lanceoleosa]
MCLSRIGSEFNIKCVVVLIFSLFASGDVGMMMFDGSGEDLEYNKESFADRIEEETDGIEEETWEFKKTRGEEDEKSKTQH